MALIGAAIEILLLRRIYRAPELFQLLATFALVLVINDATLWIWGPEDLLGPRAPGLTGSIEVLGRRLPTYDIFLIFVGPFVLWMLHLALAKTRFGRLMRAATQDREMVGALGAQPGHAVHGRVRARRLLAGLGGALQIAREPATLATDLIVIGDALRRRCGRRHGLDLRRLSCGGHHRRGEGVVHRPWRREFLAASRSISPS